MKAYTMIQNLKNETNHNIEEFVHSQIKAPFLVPFLIDAHDEIEDEIITCLRSGFNLNDKVEKYIREDIFPEVINIYQDRQTNFDNVISEILHICAGYLGQNLDDEKFSYFHEWIDAKCTFADYNVILESICNDNKVIDNNNMIQYLASFCIYADEHFSHLNITMNELMYGDYAHQDEDIKIDLTKEMPYAYSIINTSTYNSKNVPSIIVVKCGSPKTLLMYGYDEDEIEDIKQMGIGDTFYSKDYGKDVVLVRMA